MKRGPVLRHAPVINFDEVQTPSPQPHQSKSSPSAPAISQLSSRVGSMKGNMITLPVCDQEITFTLKTVASKDIDSLTSVYKENERHQQLLTTGSLDDLLPSFLSHGQQIPAFGRELDGIFEIADGSRRRKAALLSGSEYKILVGKLSDEQMRWLSRTGNDYRPVSAYERGLRYAARLKNEFNGNISQLAEAENISRKIIIRCIKTAELPLETLQLFNNPNELSARKGEELYRFHENNLDDLTQLSFSLLYKKTAGEYFSTDDLLKRLMPAYRNREKWAKCNFAKGIEGKYMDNKIIYNLTDVPQSLIDEIEKLLQDYANTLNS